MKKININIKEEGSKNYPIIIGEEILQELNNIIDLEKYSKVGILTDENLEDSLDIFESWGMDITEIIIKPGEEEKNIETVKFIWQELLENGFDRKSVLINFGGGVIGDMGGFAASTFMRGIDFIQVPTTLLSQVDASVGGKVGINFSHVKNIIGSFNQPKAVIIDIETLKTLPKREIFSGFAEIIKHGLIYDKDYLEMLNTIDPENISNAEIEKIIVGSAKIKAQVVEKDEKEGGLRKILNFGHTIGHAVESLMLETQKPLLHGEAISIGMVAEAKISELQGHISNEEFESIIEILKKYKLPTKVSDLKIEHIKIKMLSDKKNAAGKVKWTLLEKLGKAVFDIEVSEDIVEKSLELITN